jgi:hypothetical protein
VENYFNYFTEIEECYRRCRGTPSLLSTLDWALIESWKDGGIPLEAVLNGVERTFEKYHRRTHRFRRINGLAYCTQEVFAASEELKAALVESGARPSRDASRDAPFSTKELGDYFARNIVALERASTACASNNQAVLAQDLSDCAASLHGVALDKDGMADLEGLEQQLSAIEDKLTASLTRGASVELLSQFRREIERAMAEARRQMTAAQIDALERQLLKKRLFEHYGVPRLSLFYL